jgi:hypothetical protein
MSGPSDDQDRLPPDPDPAAVQPRWHAWLARFRDQTDLKSGLVSAAIGTMTMELISQATGPLPPIVIGLGALAIALVALFGVVPVLRRGWWRR